MISDSALLSLKDRNPVSAVAGAWVRLRQKSRGKHIGPCPVCSDDPQSKTAARFECTADSWVCAVCGDGGDVIKLMMKREGVDFRTAVDRLGGAREETITPAIAERRGLRDHDAGVGIWPPDYAGDDRLIAAWQRGWRKAQQRAGYAAFARERERKRLFAFWRAADPDGAALDPYFQSRAILRPPGAKLRLHPAMPYFADGRENEPRLIHQGPAMLAPILCDAKFSGLHITWLRDDRGGKAGIIDPDSGEVLPSKKVRGHKAGGYIALGGAPLDDGTFRRQMSGEGIETTAAGYTILHRADRIRPGDLFRVGIDLGNLAGRALATVAHPTLKTANGRPQRVPGPDPDMNAPAMPVPDSVDELIMLGDGDSDPFLTRTALARAAARYARAGRVVRSVFPPETK